MRALTPWSGLSTMKREMDRLFDRFREEDIPALPAFGEWAPALDVSETKDAVMVKAEVPGMDPKDIQLSLQEEVLTLKGEKKQEKEEKDEHFYPRSGPTVPSCGRSDSPRRSMAPKSRPVSSTGS